MDAAKKNSWERFVSSLKNKPSTEESKILKNIFDYGFNSGSGFMSTYFASVVIEENLKKISDPTSPISPTFGDNPIKWN